MTIAQSTVLTLALTASIGLAAGAQAGSMPRDEGAKFCNVILMDTEKELLGLRRFVDGLKDRGLYSKTRMTFILHSDKAVNDVPGQRDFFRGLYDDGNEIGVMFSGMRPAIAKWLDIPESRITLIGGQLFGDTDLEEQARATAAGFRASANVCIEGDTFKEEMWDIPHNWEGAPFLPYWVQWNSEQPAATSRTNRELDRKTATLELQWATRTMWQNYDRICLPQCFHFGEPCKRAQWRTGQLAKRGDIGWWKSEIEEMEANQKAGRTPLLYINTASEGSIFTTGGDWQNFLDSDEALGCALDLVQYLQDRGWRLTTVQEFTRYFDSHWPCPSAPSSVFLMRDTLAGRKDRDGVVIPGHGRLLHAETAHFQIIDHENRISPEMITAYDLRSPNLLRGGYTFGDPAVFTPGANRAQYASTTGNALFWSPTDPLVDGNGVPYYHLNKPAESRDRAFTLYLGDDWRPYQFAKGRISGARRKGEEILWTKEMTAPIAGTDTRVRYRHHLSGSTHEVSIEVLGDDAIGKPIHFRFCPYFHQGWDTDYRKPEDRADPRIADPSRAGQERNVFARVGGREFAFSESNIAPRREIVALTGPSEIQVYNRNPGRPKSDPDWTIDDNPDFDRGFTLSFDGTGARIEFTDPPGPGRFVTGDIDLGPHKAGRIYKFSFRYWHGKPQ